jgi:uncharacterized cofD-like protein
VLRALRRDVLPLTVVVSIAYEGEHGANVQHRVTGATVEDLRRSLEEITGEEGALLRAIRRPLTVERLGRHPLGNLVIASLAAAFGDYGRASIWLGEQLGVDGAVLPATVEPVRIDLASPAEAPGDADLSPARTLRQLRFVGERIESPEAAVSAIAGARWALLAPGSLYRSMLSVAATPAIASALRATQARVIWIANLEPGSDETARMSGLDHLRALKLHGIPVDVALLDPSAGIKLQPSDLAACGGEALLRPMRSGGSDAEHEPDLLQAALAGLIGYPTR